MGAKRIYYRTAGSEIGVAVLSRNNKTTRVGTVFGSNVIDGQI
jgi:hypothetical protein